MVLPKQHLKARRKGEKEIPKFKDWFPHGTNYEVLRLKFGHWLAKCDLSEPYLYFIAHNRHAAKFGTFGAIDIPLEPHWAYIYHRKAKLFTFAPMTPNQETVLDALNQNFYRAWLLTEKDRFDPKKSKFMPINFVKEKLFQKYIGPCRDLCYVAWNAIREFSDLTEVRPKVTKLSESIKQKCRGDISLEQEFDLLLERTTFLSQMLNEGLGWAVQFFKPGASKKKILVSHVLGTYPPARLGIPQIYLFPNRKKSLLVNLSVHSGSGQIRLFETFGPTYDLMKGLYSGFSK